MAAALVVGQASGVLAAPASAPRADVVVNESLQPILHGKATATGIGAQSIRFSARTIGSTTWNLLDNVAVSGTEAFKQLPAGRLKIADRFEYQVGHCDDTGCTSSAIKESRVSTALGAGTRPGATRLPVTVGDGISAQIDIGSGNLMLTVAGFSLPRRSGESIDVGVTYHSVTGRSTSHFAGSVGAASTGWRLSAGSDVRLRHVPGHGAVVYYGDNGLTGTFLPGGTAGTYTPPPGFKMDLTGDATNGWTLRDRASAAEQHFNAAGRLLGLKDRNNNKATFGYSSAGAPTGITTDVGPADARTLEVSTEGSGMGRITRLTQRAAGGTSASRAVSFTYDASNRLSRVTDRLGRTTDFAYGTGDVLARITAPGGAATSFSYDSNFRVTSVTQPTAGGGTALTRIDYRAGGAGADVAGPNTDPAVSVSNSPRTRYALTTDGMLLVATTTDPAGGVKSATYGASFDVTSATNAGGTTTFGYDPAVNNAESLTSVTSPTGAQATAAYQAPSAAYSPSSGTDAQQNKATYSYDAAGNRMDAANASSAKASVTYNPDGTVATSVAPAGATTSYTYNSTGQLQKITPPSGNSLGARSYTYDGYGRIATYTSGRGITETYRYDDADRQLQVDYSDGTPTVSYVYDSAGRMTERTDASGITAFTYDPLGRLASRSHPAAGGVLTYGYDRAGNLVSETDANGTTKHGYDTRNLLTSTTTPDGRVTAFGYDTDGNRIDTWFATNSAKTSWGMHTHSDYDGAGRAVRVWSARASDDATRVSDLSYSYASPGTAACPTAPPAGLDTSLKWAQTDHVAGRTTSYCYDDANRLLSATTPGGDAWSYSYDVNGNRTQTVKNGVVMQTQTVNSADQLTGSDYAHDASGNQTGRPNNATFTYNGAEHMTARTDANDTGSYTYAGTTQNELISQVVPNGSTFTYSWGRTDRNGLPLIDSIVSPKGTAYLTYDDEGRPLAIKSWTGTVAYFVLDGSGSPIALVKPDGIMASSYTYDPHGTVTSEQDITDNTLTALNPYRFAGGMYDRTTDYVKFGQRWYDPSTGRFTQQDALETLADPSRANRYEYANGNPINYVDPTGLCISCITDPPPPTGPFNTCATHGTCTNIDPGISQTERAVMRCIRNGIIGGAVNFAITKNPRGALGTAGASCAVTFTNFFD